MNRPAAASAGKSNRRFLFLALALGLVGAILLYVAVSRPAGDTSGGSASNVPVVVARVEMPARTRITASMVEVRLVPPEARSVEAFTDVEAVIGQVTRFPIAANEHILANKVVALAPAIGGQAAVSRSLSFVIPQGKRAFSIKVTEVQSVGGLVLPGDYVDIVVIYDMEFMSKPGDPSSRERVDAYFVHTLVQNVEVLAVSQTIVDLVPGTTSTADGQRARNTEGKPNPEAVTITLALTPEEAQKVYLAEGNGRIRLSLRPFGDADVRPVTHMIETELFPPNLPNPFLQR